MFPPPRTYMIRMIIHRPRLLNHSFSNTGCLFGKVTASHPNDRAIITMSIQKCKPSFDDGSLTIKRAPFTTLYNKPLQTCPNMEAIAVWAYLQSQADTWELSPAQLKNHFKVGKNKIYKILAYMISANLLVRHVQIALNGRRVTTSYTVLDGTEFIDPSLASKDDYPISPLSRNG